MKPSNVATTEAIILAAGQGTRLRPLTNSVPKCMVELLGRPLLMYQLEALQAVGIAPENITVVCGYRSDVIELALRNAGLPCATVLNTRFACTNMVESLMAARTVLEKGRDTLVLYADLVYQKNILNALLSVEHEFAATVDLDWQNLWSARNEHPLNDAETLKLGPEGEIIELGKKPRTLEDIEGQYMGLIKIGAGFGDELLRHYDSLDREGRFDGKDFDNMYMTSFLQSLIHAGKPLQAVGVRGGWLEVDTTGDLELYAGLAAAGELDALWKRP